MVPTDGQSYTHRSQSPPEKYFRINMLILYQSEREEGKNAWGRAEC